MELFVSPDSSGEGDMLMLCCAALGLPPFAVAFGGCVCGFAGCFCVCARVCV